MLVTIDSSDAPIGIAVCEWKVGKELRYFVLIPYHFVNQNFAEVEAAFDSIQVVSPAKADWRFTSQGFGDGAAGYAMSEDTKQDLYEVWDNGARNETDRSARLYRAFETIIDGYKNEANAYLEKLANDKYTEALVEAKEKGWDTSLIVPDQLTFPYDRSTQGAWESNS